MEPSEEDRGDRSEEYDNRAPNRRLPQRGNSQEDEESREDPYEIPIDEMDNEYMQR